jgi:biopolymer transport protein TolR
VWVWSPSQPAQKEIEIMQLNRGELGSELQSEINITPLVDVVLVLLIIFMVVVPLLIKGYDVDVPRSSSETVSAQSAEQQLVLSVGPAACPMIAPPAGDGVPADCHVTLADQKIPAGELPARVAEVLGGQPAEKRVLFLAADDSLNYEGVLRIIDLAKSGVEDLKIEFIAAN